MSTRPAVSVIVPYAGPDAALRSTLATLEALVLDAGDEILLADNGPGPEPGRRGLNWPVGVERVAASGVRAPGFARNRGAAHAHGDWLVFLDADVRPSPGLLDAYFSPHPGESTAVLAGGIRDIPGADTRAARHSARRGQMSHLTTLGRSGRPYAQTANCAVRREAFAAIGGFAEDARYGEDADLCWRLADTGWDLEEREHALAEHPSRTALRPLLAQLTGHGAGAAWLDRRYPGEFPPAGPRSPARSAARATRALIGGHRTAATEAALDGLEALAFAAGRRRSNRPRQA